MHHNSISDECAKMFAEQLGKPNLIIHHLDLSHNMINDAGGECLAKCLSLNTSLTHLNLKRNNMRETTGMLMVDSVKQNRSLVSLNLERNQIPPNMIEQIVEML